MSRLWKILGWLAVAAILAAGSAGCNGSGSAAQIEEPEVKMVKVSVVEVQPTEIRDILVLPGQTLPWQDVTLAADQPGRVEEVSFREGDVVKKGDLIAMIQVAALKAGYDNALANVALAEELYKRRQKLFERNIISREELDQSKNKLEVARGMLRQAKVNYDNGFVYSPIDGTINELFVDPGEFVGQGKPVADLVNIDRIKIEVSVPEMDVRFLKADQQALVRIDALPDFQKIGIIDFVAFKADPATKTFNVRVLIDNMDGPVRPGMIARVIFLKRTISDALVAPLFSLVDRGGERLVYVEKEGVAHARTVSLGVIEGDRIQITEGLTPGDRLIVTGQNNVQDGTKVQVQ